MQPRFSILAIFALFTAGLAGHGCGIAAPQPPAGPDRIAEHEIEEIESVLDRFHQAAAEADGETYFSLLHEDAVFLGTDASERWTRESFRAWVQEGGYFDEPPGWVYVPIERHLNMAPQGDCAWFDEIVRNESYGDLRGSGVLLRTPGGWRIAQYNLHFAVPNEVAARVVEVIRPPASGQDD